MRTRIIIPAVISILMLFGCRSVRTVQIQEVERIRDRVIEVPVAGDSSTLLALLRCDSANKVTLAALQEIKTENLTSDFSINDGRLIYRTIRAPAIEKIIVKDTFIYKDIPVRVEVIKEVNRLNAIQRIQVWLGRAAIIISLLISIYYKWLR